MLTASVSPGLRHELTLLVLSRHPLVVIESLDEEKVTSLVQQVAVDLSLPLLTWSSTNGLERRGAGVVAETRDPDRALAHVLDLMGELMVLFHDLHPYLERPEIVRRLRESEAVFRGRRASLLMSGSAVALPSELLPLSSRLTIELPGEPELERLVRLTARELEAQSHAAIELEPADYGSLARALRGLHVQEARRVLYRAALDDGRLDLSDVEGVLARKQHRLGETSQLEWVEPLPGVSSLGGSENLKEWAQRRSEAFTPAARRFGVEAPKGLLLVGVPGTGKSLACRAIAGEWSLPLLRLDPGRLYDKFVGETEANLRRALGVVQSLAPAVLWVDEIEKALAAGGGQADDGLSQRVLGALLTWMQERSAPVFVMATCNDVGSLPIELLRRGRFDEVFFVDLPGRQARSDIFAIQLRRRERDPANFDLERLAELSRGFSGAEIEGVVVAALYHAFSERQPLSGRFLEAEIAATRPLSRLRPQEIEALRDWGREHAVTA